MILQPAAVLEEVFKTLRPDPLMSLEELAAFYGSKLNEVRGSDVVDEMKFSLGQAYGGAYYKAFLMGHSGVGKSTEITRLLQEVEGQYRPIRFSAMSDLDPGNFKPFDVLLLMMVLVAEETEKETGKTPPDSVLQQIWDWFGKETVVHTQQTHAGVEAAAGLGPTPDTWWGKVLGLFASIKGEIKYSADRKKEVVEYRLSRTSTLLDLANRLLDECNRLLREARHREWLFVGEEFDKSGIRSALTEDLFVNYANIFKDLRTHLIFNIPFGLVCSARSRQLPQLSGGIRPIPDTPVFRPDHTPHCEGRAALRQILEARVQSGLFEGQQMMRLIVASGGNLRDLFQLVARAALKAIVRKPAKGKIGRAEADIAINELRTEYQRRLGESPYDPVTVTYPQKAERLIEIYQQNREAEIPDPVLHSLLTAGAVQEFNGAHWCGVHPLVVDLLKRQGKLADYGGEEAAGGTE